MQSEILVVMPYKHTAAQGNELVLSLTGWLKFCMFKYHFVVIGDYTEEQKLMFPDVEFIYCETITEVMGQYTPHLDIQHKMEIIMNKFSDKYDGFVRIADDEYAIKPFNLEDITTPHYNRFDDITIKGIEGLGSRYWVCNKLKTLQLLKSENLSTINYTTHYPYYYEFDKLKEIWDKYNMRKESYVLEDVYFNYFKHEEPVLDDTIRFRVDRRRMYQNEFLKAIENPNIKFVNNRVNTWCDELKNQLTKLYTSNSII